MSEPSIYDEADDPYRAIRIGDPGPAGEATKWGQLLTLFMRVIALFWMLQGLMLWRVILMSQQPIFDAMPRAAAFAIIFFAVLNLVAAVGLWLATPWGGVMWLLIASAQMFVASSMPGFFVGGYWLIAIDLFLIILYFVLTFEAGRDFEARRGVSERRRRRRAEAGEKPLVRNGLQARLMSFFAARRKAEPSPRFKPAGAAPKEPQASEKTKKNPSNNAQH
jgi:hypothetical protein